MANCKIYMTANDARRLTMAENKSVMTTYSDVTIKDIMDLIHHQIKVIIPSWLDSNDEFKPTHMMSVSVSGLLRRNVVEKLIELGYDVHTEQVTPGPEYTVVSWDI